MSGESGPHTDLDSPSGELRKRTGDDQADAWGEIEETLISPGQTD